MDAVWWSLVLLVMGLCITVVAAATVLFAVGLPASIAGVVILENARRRR